MTLRVSIFNFVFLVSSIHLSGGDDSGNQCWYDEGMVPNVVSSIPPTTAQVTFPSGATMVTGQSLTLSQVATQPQSIVCQYNPTDFYTIIMLDPDSPGAGTPGNSQYAQWIVVNVQGQSTTNLNLDTGDVIAPYFAPLPENNSGKHHYILLIYLQSTKLNIQTLTQRDNFNVENFASQCGLGSAIAGNFFTANANNI